jgi:Lysyl-tRNA synthetase (class II)
VKFVDALGEYGLWTRDEEELRRRLQERNVDVSHDPTWAKLIDHAHSHFVEPNLVQPTILYDYPIELSPFARSTSDDPTLVERFEYFAGGMELGNAFTEINDAEEQAARFSFQEGERAAGDVRRKAAIPTTSRRCRTACRRPVGSGSASTGSRCSSRVTSRSGT